MKVLVTGGAGYIGSHTTQKLLDAGYSVVVYDNLSTGFHEAIPGTAEFVRGDVRDKNHLSQTMKEKNIQAVVHFAAKLIVPESIEKPVDYYENNTLGVLTLTQACLENHIKMVVFSSTAAVYGDANVSGLITEQSLTAPLNPYGQSKLMSEFILRDCEAPHGLKSVCLRYFNVAGAATNGNNGQRTKNATHLIKVASEAACGKRNSVGIFGTDYPTDDGTGVRDYIHVEDLADLHVLALKYMADGGASQIFNCGYGKGFSVKEVINTVKEVSGVPFTALEQPRRPGDAAMLVADSSKIRKAFNWTPQRNDLKLICQTAYEWEKRYAVPICLFELRCEKMRHVAFHINSFMKGGIERVLIQQLRSFDRSNTRLTLLIHCHFPELEVLLSEVPNDVQIIHLLDKKFLNQTRIQKALGKLSWWLRVYDELLQLPRKIYSSHKLKKLLPQYDVVIDFDVTMGFVISRFHGPKIGWFHFSVKNYHNGKKHRLKRLGKKLALYDKVIVISDQMKIEAQKLYPEIKNHFVRIYNGFDLEALLAKGNEELSSKEKYQNILKSKYIFSSGRFDERQKDFTTLIKAFALIAEDVPHQLVIAGEGPHEENIKNLVHELKIQDRVHFLGFQENPLPFLKHCDFFVHSSKYEGLPTVVIEALIFLKTIIASDCPTGPREILNNGEFGYLFPVGDVEALSSLMKNVALNSSFRIDPDKLESQTSLFDIKTSLQSLEAVIRG